jgi:hypothetical protein
VLKTQICVTSPQCVKKGYQPRTNIVKKRRVIWLQNPTVFWVGGGTISLGCFMYMGLVMLGRYKHIGERVASWHTFYF